jgi:type III restriction enzyme
MAQGRHRDWQVWRGRHRAGADTVTLNETDIASDLLTELQDRTQLTRKTIARILTESTRLNEFKRNPQQFIELAAESINRCKRLALVDGIKYQRLGDDAYWAQELFEDPKNVLMGYLNEHNARMNTEKSVYEHVAIDSAVEWEFADQLEKTMRSRSTPSSRTGSRCLRLWAATT